jgi:hypothetical protein
MKDVVMTIIGFAIALGLIIGVVLVIVDQAKSTGNTSAGDAKTVGTKIGTYRATPP